MSIIHSQNGSNCVFYYPDGSLEAYPVDHAELLKQMASQMAQPWEQGLANHRAHNASLRDRVSLLKGEIDALEKVAASLVPVPKPVVPEFDGFKVNQAPLLSIEEQFEMSHTEELLDQIASLANAQEGAFLSQASARLLQLLTKNPKALSLCSDHVEYLSRLLQEKRPQDLNEWMRSLSRLAEPKEWVWKHLSSLLSQKASWKGISKECFQPPLLSIWMKEKDSKSFFRSLAFISLDQPIVFEGILLFTSERLFPARWEEDQVCAGIKRAVETFSPLMKQESYRSFFEAFYAIWNASRSTLKGTSRAQIVHGFLKGISLEGFKETSVYMLLRILLVEIEENKDAFEKTVGLHCLIEALSAIRHHAQFPRELLAAQLVDLYEAADKNLPSFSAGFVFTEDNKGADLIEILYDVVKKSALSERFWPYYFRWMKSFIALQLNEIKKIQVFEDAERSLIDASLQEVFPPSIDAGDIGHPPLVQARVLARLKSVILEKIADLWMDRGTFTQHQLNALNLTAQLLTHREANLYADDPVVNEEREKYWCLYFRLVLSAVEKRSLTLPTDNKAFLSVFSAIAKGRDCFDEYTLKQLAMIALQLEMDESIVMKRLFEMRKGQSDYLFLLGRMIKELTYSKPVPAQHTKCLTTLIEKELKAERITRSDYEKFKSQIASR